MHFNTVALEFTHHFTQLNNISKPNTMPNHSNLTPAERERLAYLGGLADTAALHAQVDDNTMSIEALEVDDNTMSIEALEEENYKLEQKIEQLEYTLQCANEEIRHLAHQLLRYEG